jgi:hypothetical protein
MGATAMEQKSESTNAQKDTERAALFASGAVVVGFILYWSIQIQSVREMLELAYG